MSHFDASMAPHFRTLLSQREALLTGTLETEPDPVEASDRNDVTDIEERAEEKTLAAVQEIQHDRAAHELALVRAALHRLDTGQFGICQDCGEPIELRRLEALPFAERCIACQQAHEQAQGG